MAGSVANSFWLNEYVISAEDFSGRERTKESLESSVHFRQEKPRIWSTHSRLYGLEIYSHRASLALEGSGNLVLVHIDLQIAVWGLSKELEKEDEVWESMIFDICWVQTEVSPCVHPCPVTFVCWQLATKPGTPLKSGEIEMKLLIFDLRDGQKTRDHWASRFPWEWATRPTFPVELFLARDLRLETTYWALSWRSVENPEEKIKGVSMSALFDSTEDQKTYLLEHDWECWSNTDRTQVLDSPTTVRDRESR